MVSGALTDDPDHAPADEDFGCVGANRFQKGIDGLARVCKESLQRDPFEGTVFVFRNSRGTAIKVLVYDGQGFWLYAELGIIHYIFAADLWPFAGCL